MVQPHPFEGPVGPVISSLIVPPDIISLYDNNYYLYDYLDRRHDHGGHERIARKGIRFSGSSIGVITGCSSWLSRLSSVDLSLSDQDK